MTKRTSFRAFAAAAVLTSSAGVGAAEWAYPDPQKPWSEPQYTQFYFTHYNTHLALPHRRSAPSRALFERLISRENIDAILASPDSRYEKLKQLSIILSDMGSVRAYYNLATLEGEPLQQELTDVQVFNLYVLGIIAEAGSDGLPSLPCAPAMKTSFLGVIRSLSEQHLYSAGQIAELGDALARSYPSVALLFSPAESAELATVVSRLKSRQVDGRALKALALLQATLAGSQ